MGLNGLRAGLDEGSTETWSFCEPVWIYARTDSFGLQGAGGWVGLLISLRYTAILSSANLTAAKHTT